MLCGLPPVFCGHLLVLNKKAVDPDALKCRIELVSHTALAAVQREGGCGRWLRLKSLALGSGAHEDPFIPMARE